MREGWWSGGTEVASESVDWVRSEAAWTVVGGALRGDRLRAGLAPCVLAGTILGVLPRTVLGALLVVEVRSVPSASPSLTLDRDAVVLSLEVTRVPLSTLRLPPSISCTASTFFRRMLFALAVFLRSVAGVAVNGGLGGARAGGGLGGSRVGAGGSRISSFPCSDPRSVGSGVKGDFLRSAGSGRE